jgi:hypothetical protein
MMTKNATKYSIWEKTWIALYKKKRQTPNKTHDKHENSRTKKIGVRSKFRQNELLLLNRQSGFVLKYRNCTHLPSWIR